MGYSNRDNNRSGGRSFGGKRSFGGNRSFGGGHPVRHPDMHDAVCANCGQACKVPFKPTGDKPVYCRDCFAKMGGGEKRSERHDTPRQIVTPREPSPTKADFDALNAKLDKILALLSATMPKEVAQEAAAPVEKKKKVSKKEESANE